MPLKPVPEGALDRFKRASEAEEPQRKAILAAKNFRAGNQWPEEVRQQRMGAPAITGMAAQPARPCLTVDRVSQPVRQVSNTVRQSNFSIDTIPVGDGADKETAEIFKGWMRRVQNEARDDAPIEWAADQAAEGGIGWFRITTYEISDDSFDQDARLDRVTNNLSVYCDPAAQKPTRSDAKFMFQTENVPREEFKRLYPDADVTSLDAFRATGDGDGWVEEDTIRVAEYWRVEYDRVRLIELNDGTTLKGDAIPDGLKKGDGPQKIKRERMVQQPKVKWSKITATQELQATDWLGTRIPFIPILGEELNVDGKAIVRGVIAPAMDAQRMVNYTYSAAVEAVALAPKAPFIYAEGQIEQYKSIWQTANTTNYFGLPYTPVSLLGQPVEPPRRSAVEAPIQAMVELMVRSEEGVKATTGIFDPSLGNLTTKDRSGEALKALQNASTFGQSNYQDNVTRAMVYAGELLVELGPKILDRPGRILQILQAGDVPQQIMLGQPFQHAANGVPQPINGPDQQPIMDPALAKISAGMAKFYDLSGGKYGVVVSIGRAETTKRQEGNSALGELIPHMPPEMGAALVPSYIETLDFGDAEKVANIARRALPPQLQDPPPEMANLPPAVQQQMQQMQQGIQQRDQALQQAKQIIDTDSIKAKRDLDKIRIEGTKELLIHQMDNAAKVLVARIGADKQLSSVQVEGEEERKATGIQQAHEHYQNVMQQAHEFNMATLGHQQNLEAIAAQPPQPEGAPA